MVSTTEGDTTARTHNKTSALGKSQPPTAPVRARLYSPWHIAVAVVIVAIAAALRIGASFGDLWIDEIWSLAVALRLRSPLEIFTQIHNSNNNHLNTFFLYLLGDQRPWFVYRIPSILAGVGTVLVAGHIGLRRSRTEATLAMLLTGFSYLLVHYSSEARGYSCAMFFDLLAFDFLESYFNSKSVWKLLGFWAACILSLLSHLMFVMVYAAFVVWSVVRLARERRGLARFLAGVTLCQGIPVATFATLYVVAIVNDAGLTRQATPDYPLRDVIVETLALAVGGPQFGWGGLAAATVAGLLCFAAMRFMIRKEKSDEAIFYLAVIIVAPTLLIAFKIFSSSDVLLLRYFLGSVVFFLLLLGRFLADWLLGDSRRKIVAASILALVVIGNIWHIARLMQVGRGSYLEAVRFMAGSTPGDTVTFASDHSSAPGVVHYYVTYARRFGDEKGWIYFPNGGAPQWLVKPTHVGQRRSSTWPARPEWVILHVQDRENAPPPSIRFGTGEQYTLVREYPYAGLSGYRWFLYRTLQSAP
jgi:hypothetical protein